MTCCHICCTRQSNLFLPEDGQDGWLQHVAALYNKHKYCETSWC